jgi:hypothetical protein
MTGAGLRSASSLRALVMIGLGVALTTGSVMRPVLARAQGSAPAQQAPADPLKFSHDGPLLLIYQVKPDRAADFEALWTAIRAGLAKSTKDDVKKFGESLVPYKVSTTPNVYVFKLDQPSKTFSYNPVAILYDADHMFDATGLFTRAEADELYNKKFAGTGGEVYTAIQPWPLVKVGG